MSRLISGLSEISDRYDSYIIDIFGVLHDGIRPFPGTLAALQGLRDAGKSVCLLSNSPRLAARAVEHMASMGISPSLYDHVVTSGEATHMALQKRDDDFHASCGHDCWFIGKSFIADLADLDLRFVDGPQNASFILNSIPGSGDAEIKRLREQLSWAAERDLPMICANPDLVVHVGEHLYECAGTFAAEYEEAGGRVVYHGKPHAPVYERCYELLGRPDKSRLCAIGDSLHTDIAGANGFGIHSILNLAGIHREEITSHTLAHLETAAVKPSHVITDFK